MQNVPKGLVEVGPSFEQHYRPVLDLHGWKVAAMLRFCDMVNPEKPYRVERHMNIN